MLSCAAKSWGGGRGALRAPDIQQAEAASGVLHLGSLGGAREAATPSKQRYDEQNDIEYFLAYLFFVQEWY